MLHAIEGSFGSIKVSDRIVESVINVTRDIRPESSAVGIGSLSVGSNVESSRISTDGGLKIKSVKVGGDWIASDLAAGAMPGDDFYGNDNDYAIDGLSRGSVIGKLLIQGIISGTTATGDSFGICAGQIGHLKIAGEKLEVFRNSRFPPQPTTFPSESSRKSSAPSSSLRSRLGRTNRCSWKSQRLTPARSLLLLPIL